MITKSARYTYVVWFSLLVIVSLLVTVNFVYLLSYNINYLLIAELLMYIVWISEHWGLGAYIKKSAVMHKIVGFTHVIMWLTFISTVVYEAIGDGFVKTSDYVVVAIFIAMFMTLIGVSLYYQRKARLSVENERS